MNTYTRKQVTILTLAALLVGLAFGVATNYLNLLPQTVTTPKAVNVGPESPLVTNKSARVSAVRVLSINKTAIEVEDDQAKNKATFPLAEVVYIGNSTDTQATTASTDISQVKPGMTVSMTLLLDKDHYKVESILYTPTQ